MTKQQQPVDFEAALTELSEIVEKLEHGNLPLENSLQKFERGMTLSKQCQTALQQAEQKVKVLTEQYQDPSADD